MRIGAGAALVVVAMLAAGCAVDRDGPAVATPALEGLTARHPCPRATGFTCAILRVPLDHRGVTAGMLRLQVAMTTNARAPKGTLVFLTGGPGQPAVPFAPRVRQILAPIAAQYRLMLVDQRGTGGGALRCSALQRAVGSSDLTVPPTTAVSACAAALGPRRQFFSTADSVADLELLRRALGAKKLSLDGVSYGTFVAQRYAVAHPDRVARLVLDSVVPVGGLDGLEVDGMRSVARVLRAVCRAQRCATDPVADVAALARRPRLGPRLFDTLVALSIWDPSFSGVVAALHAARGGRSAPLDELMAAVRRGQRASATELSQGLHAATLCADLRPPWGGPGGPTAGRLAALRSAAAGVDANPFGPDTVIGNGLIQTCLRWPPTPVPARVDGAVPHVPTLLLAGGRDLSTPLAWARRQAAAIPGARLVVVPEAGHSVQSTARGQAGRRAVVAFLQR